MERFAKQSHTVTKSQSHKRNYSRYFLICVLCLVSCVLVGCSSVVLPNYIKDTKPYEKKFYADFNTTKEAITKALDKMGWNIVESADPVTFEATKAVDNPDVKQVLLFSDVKQSWFLIGTKYQRLNIYLRSKDSTSTEVDLRYMKVSSYPFKSFTRYKNKTVANKIFKGIEEELNKQ